MQTVCIIPALNEEPTIAQVVSGAFKHCNAVLVVNDGSQDRTAEESLQAGATVITHILRLGTGGALSTGFRIALKMDHEIFLTMDGDGQHNPEEIPTVLNPIMRGDADIVIGSRMLMKQGSMPLSKKIGNKILSTVTSLAVNAKLTDSQSGFRAYRREVLEYAIHRARDYRWASEILILAAQGNFRIKEVPITTIYLPQRQRGADVKDGFKIFYSTMKRSH